MKILLTGGGSGGHITPLLAVAHELKALHPDVELNYVGQRGDLLSDIPAQHPAITAVYSVRAGKFRRYHGEGLRQLLDIPTVFKNIRDGFFVLIGLWQSWRLLGRLKPDVIFIKGGFVGVPVGLAAAAHHIPYVTHDSDAIPGLANRIIARWARWHAVALPKEMYAYPPARTVSVGVPVARDYQPVTAALQARYRQDLHVEQSSKIIFVTGGGLGAQRLNKAVAAIAATLLKHYPDAVLVHTVGRRNETVMDKLYDDILKPSERTRVLVRGFVTDLYRYSGAADVIIARAGATNLAEFAAQKKACIIVPNPNLTGGHQLKNALSLRERGAALVIQEDELAAQPDRLTAACIDVLDHPAKREQLGTHLADLLAHPQAARELAELLLKTVNPNRLSKI